MITRRVALSTALVLLSTESVPARADDCELEPFGDDWENLETGADEWFDDTARELGRDIATAPLRKYAGSVAIGAAAVVLFGAILPVAVTLGLGTLALQVGVEYGRASLRAADVMDKRFQAFLDSD